MMYFYKGPVCGALWHLLVWLQIATSWTLSQIHLGGLSKGLSCLISSRLTEIQLLNASVRHHVIFLSDINNNLHCLSAKTATTLTLAPSNQCYNYNFNNLAPQSCCSCSTRVYLQRCVSAGLQALVLSLLLNVNILVPHLLQRVTSSDISISWEDVLCAQSGLTGETGYYSAPAGSGTLLFVFLLIRPRRGLSPAADVRHAGQRRRRRRRLSSLAANRLLFWAV